MRALLPLSVTLSYLLDSGRLCVSVDLSARHWESAGLTSRVIGDKLTRRRRAEPDRCGGAPHERPPLRMAQEATASARSSVLPSSADL